MKVTRSSWYTDTTKTIVIIVRDQATAFCNEHPVADRPASCEVVGFRCGLPENLTGPQLLKKFSAFYGT
jgi:hypothetical protein